MRALPDIQQLRQLDIEDATDFNAFREIRPAAHEKETLSV
jgi:hypothetical protein